MIKCEERKLKELLEKFYNLIILDKGKYLIFEEFPYGCCGNISLFLCNYLLDNGFKNCYYVSGRIFADTIMSHAWVEVDDIIVDLTIQQFATSKIIKLYDFKSEYFIGTSRKIHSQFSMVTKSLAEQFSDSDELGITYHKIFN